MPAGLTAMLQILGGIGQSLLTAFTYIFNWVFAVGTGGTLENWPVLISLFLMLLVFIKQFITHVIHGV